MKNHIHKILDVFYAIKTVLFIFVFIIISSCEKENGLNSIVQNEWKVKTIVINNKSLNPPSKTFREEAYILKFGNDSCFSLATSVNYAGGKYSIVSDKDICMSDYQTFTQVCCETEFDKHLLYLLNKITSYSSKNNKLTFLADKNNKVLFEKLSSR